MTEPLARLTALRASIVAGAAKTPHPLLAAYLAKVEREASSITDQEVEALLAAGIAEDEIFEATLGTALGAAVERLEAGLRALAGAHQ